MILPAGRALISPLSKTCSRDFGLHGELTFMPQLLAASCFLLLVSDQLSLWAVSAEQLQAEGRLTGLDCLTQAGNHRVLLVHEGSGARVWDLRWGVCCPPVL